MVLEKNLNTAVELYKKLKITNNKNITKNDNPNKTFLDFKNLSILFCLNVKVLKSSGLLTKPLFLPIFKNLFFLSLIIYSEDKSLK